MTSLWNATATAAGKPDCPVLRGEHRADVAVVGAGVVGLTVARYLHEGGRTVAVLEARQVGAQVTGRSTGKLTSQHGLAYAGLIKRLGRNRARDYAEANQWAIEEIARCAESRNIECSFTRIPAHVVGSAGDCSQPIEEEARAAASVGLPASVTDPPAEGPPARAALRFENQAQFHPRRYLDGLAQSLAADGVAIFEDSRVVRVDSQRSIRAVTDGGAVVAGALVVATNLPFLDSGGFFARAYPRAHVAVAARLADGAPEPSMCISLDASPYSWRRWQGDDGDYLVALSESFIPGHVDDVARLAQQLEEDVRQHWPVAEVSHRWMTEDYHAADRHPFAGPLTPGSRTMFTATGFGGWGLTNGTAAARTIADRILERDSPWAELYDTWRLRSATTGRFVRRNADVARHMVTGFAARGSGRSRSHLARGEGAILKTEDGKAAVYRDDDGSFHVLSPYCPHMGCLLAWNNFERTWDCGCHGSRFEATGRLLHGPARRDMKARPRQTG